MTSCTLSLPLDIKYLQFFYHGQQIDISFGINNSFHVTENNIPVIVNRDELSNRKKRKLRQVNAVIDNMSSRIDYMNEKDEDEIEIDHDSIFEDIVEQYKQARKVVDKFVREFKHDRDNMLRGLQHSLGKHFLDINNLGTYLETDQRKSVICYITSKNDDEKIRNIKDLILWALLQTRKFIENEKEKSKKYLNISSSKKYWYTPYMSPRGGAVIPIPFDTFGKNIICISKSNDDQDCKYYACNLINIFYDKNKGKWNIYPDFNDNSIPFELIAGDIVRFKNIIEENSKLIKR